MLTKLAERYGKEGALTIYSIIKAQNVRQRAALQRPLEPVAASSPDIQDAPPVAPSPDEVLEDSLDRSKGAAAEPKPASLNLDAEDLGDNSDGDNASVNTSLAAGSEQGDEKKSRKRKLPVDSEGKQTKARGGKGTGRQKQIRKPATSSATTSTSPIGDDKLSPETTKPKQLHWRSRQKMEEAALKAGDDEDGDGESLIVSSKPKDMQPDEHGLMGISGSTILDELGMTIGAGSIEESLIRVSDHHDEFRLDLVEEEEKAKDFLRRDVRNRCEAMYYPYTP